MENEVLSSVNNDDGHQGLIFMELKYLILQGLCRQPVSKDFVFKPSANSKIQGGQVGRLMLKLLKIA